MLFSWKPSFYPINFTTTDIKNQNFFKIFILLHKLFTCIPFILLIFQKISTAIVKAIVHIIKNEVAYLQVLQQRNYVSPKYLNT